ERFANAPAVVAALLDDVDFFPEILADVGSVEEFGDGIEGHAPDVANAEAVDFWAGVGLADEGVVFGNGIGFSRVFVIDVDAENFAEERAELLAVALGVVGATAVAQADGEVTVGAEQQ